MVLVIWGVCNSFGLTLTPISLPCLSLPTLFYGSWLRSWLLILLTSWLLALTIGYAYGQITGCNLSGSLSSRFRILALVEGHGDDTGLLGLYICGQQRDGELGKMQQKKLYLKMPSKKKKAFKMFNEKIQLLNTKYLWGSRGRLEVWYISFFFLTGKN